MESNSVWVWLPVNGKCFGGSAYALGLTQAAALQPRVWILSSTARSLSDWNSPAVIAMSARLEGEGSLWPLKIDFSAFLVATTVHPQSGELEDPKQIIAEGA